MSRRGAAANHVGEPGAAAHGITNHRASDLPREGSGTPTAGSSTQIRGPWSVTDRLVSRLMVRPRIEGGPAMITGERARLEVPPPIVLPRRQESAPRAVETVEVSAAEIRRFLRRLVLAFVGFGIAMLGFSLMLTVFLVFIGLPLFIVGVAIMQAQES
jgi:hypothetical protein